MYVYMHIHKIYTCAFVDIQNFAKVYTAEFLYESLLHILK